MKRDLILLAVGVLGGVVSLLLVGLMWRQSAEIAAMRLVVSGMESRVADISRDSIRTQSRMDASVDSIHELRDIVRSISDGRPSDPSRLEDLKLPQ